MKTLDQLGISPAPWNLYPYGPSTMSTVATHGDIETADGRSFFPNGEFPEIQDARMIAAAPDLYKSLIGLLEIVCVDCNSAYKVDGKCVKCPRVVAAEAALEKAGGAE